MPIVSVLMTSFNRQATIAESIKSVLASSFKDYEFIIVDDASTDRTAEIVESFLPDQRIKFYQNSVNQGDYPNRNIAASYAKGKYLKYVDSDDLLYTHSLQEMVSAIEKFPGAAYGLSNVPSKCGNEPAVYSSLQAYEYHFFNKGLFIKGPSSAIFNREIFEKENGFEPHKMISDIDIWHRLSLKYPMVLMKNDLVFIRQHAESELKDKPAFLLKSEMLKWKYLRHPLCPLSYEQVMQVRNSRLRRYISFIASGIKNFNFAQVKNYIKLYGLVYSIKIKKK